MIKVCKICKQETHNKNGKEYDSEFYCWVCWLKNYDKMKNEKQKSNT